MCNNSMMTTKHDSHLLDMRGTDLVEVGIEIVSVLQLEFCATLQSLLSQAAGTLKDGKRFICLNTTCESCELCLTMQSSGMQPIPVALDHLIRAVI